MGNGASFPQMLVFTERFAIFKVKIFLYLLVACNNNRFCFFALLDNERPNNHYLLVILYGQKTTNMILFQN